MQRTAIQQFQDAVYDAYARLGRHDLPWRLPEPGSEDHFDPYKILVSELMLQQTQVPRVIPKYLAFLARFPNVATLADAPLGEVLKVWSGLGYNRRAKFLHEAARMVMHDFHGHLPKSQVELTSLPGIGMNTAGAIMAYAYNAPVVFIETNIRTVFIHHFLADEPTVSDTAIRVLVAETLDRESPRQWYWALMDYGSHLKQTVGNLSRASTTYAKQSRFQGSRRQIRGQVIQLLGKAPLSLPALVGSITDERLESVLADLLREGLITKEGDQFKL